MRNPMTQWKEFLIFKVSHTHRLKTTKRLTHWHMQHNFFFTYQIATLLPGLNNYYRKTFMKLHKKLEKTDMPLTSIGWKYYSTFQG
jgi:hypothetical protein